MLNEMVWNSMDLPYLNCSENRYSFEMWKDYFLSVVDICLFFCISKAMPLALELRFLGRDPSIRFLKNLQVILICNECWDPLDWINLSSPFLNSILFKPVGEPYIHRIRPDQDIASSSYHHLYMLTSITCIPTCNSEDATCPKMWPAFFLWHGL